MSEEQREHICKRIDNLTRRGLLADWGYAVPIAPSPSPSKSLSPAAVNNPELPTTHNPSPSVVDEPLPVVNGVPITGPSNPPTSPIEPPGAQDTECVSYVPVMGVHQQTNPPLYRTYRGLYRVTDSKERYPLLQNFVELYTLYRSA